jgi:hypothetical protein
VTPEDGCLGLKHVLIVKAKVREKINSCIIDGKLYVTRLNILNKQSRTADNG